MLEVKRRTLISTPGFFLAFLGGQNQISGMLLSYYFEQLLQLTIAIFTTPIEKEELQVDPRF